MIHLRNIEYILPEGTEPTRLVASAILVNGKLWTGKRHSDCIKNAKEDGVAYVSSENQGFYTDDERFVTRTAGKHIVFKYGQISREKYFEGVLTSEDLW